MMKRNGNHAAEHDKLALGEIDDACRVVDNIEPYGDDRIDRTVGDACNDILRKKFDIHPVGKLSRGGMPPQPKALFFPGGSFLR